MGALERPVASPCISVCVVDPRGSGVCVGCGRTLDEIAAWGTLDASGKRKVLASLPPRRARWGEAAARIRAAYRSR